MSYYIQITTKCNYRCRHCCFSCTEQGEDMTMNTFEQAIKSIDPKELAKWKLSRIALGGGEPTLHPHFWDMIELCIKNGYSGKKLWLATNGSQREITKKLSEMAKRGELAVSVSKDRYRPPLDPEVEEWFKNDCKDEKDLRSIYINNRAIKMGRARRIRGAKEQCCCEGPFIIPNGDVYQCGCDERIKIGNVYTEYKYIWDNLYKSLCSKELLRRGIPPSYTPGIYGLIPKRIINSN